MTVMNCTEFRAAIASGMENRKPPSPEAAVHLDGCQDSRCQSEWDEALLLDRAIASWRSTRPKIDVADAVVSAWKSGEREVVRPISTVAGSVRGSATPSRSARAAAAIAAAAVTLLAVVLLTPGPDRPLAKQEHRPERHDPARDAGLAYVTYAQSAAQIVTDAVVLTLGGEEQMEDPKVTPIGIPWEADWSPLGGDVHAALDDLMESLPAEQQPQS
jgi:hypothetical protein